MDACYLPIYGASMEVFGSSTDAINVVAGFLLILVLIRLGRRKRRREAAELGRLSLRVCLHTLRARRGQQHRDIFRGEISDDVVRYGATARLGVVRRPCRDVGVSMYDPGLVDDRWWRSS